MAKQKQERREFTEEEKAEFLLNHMRLNVWVDKAALKEFDEIIKAKGLTRAEAVSKLLQKFVAKQKAKGDKK